MKFEQVGTVIEPASEYYSGRLTKKERKTTLTEELLSDRKLGEYRYVTNMNRSKGTMQQLLTSLLRIILTNICYTGNAKFARLKNVIGQVELTSGRIEVHSQGSVQSKEGIEARELKKRCPVEERWNLLRGVPAILAKLLGCANNKACLIEHLQIPDAIIAPAYF